MENYQLLVLGAITVLLLMAYRDVLRTIFKSSTKQTAARAMGWSAGVGIANMIAIILCFTLSVEAVLFSLMISIALAVLVASAVALTKP